ncbi:MAG: carboxypeptidase regulatory-like domain-containing protein [Bacteroidota bacterium]
MRSTANGYASWPRWAVAGLSVLLMMGSAGALHGQDVRAPEARYTFALRGVPLEAALNRFVSVTGQAVSYDPLLVEGVLSFCLAEEVVAEAVLRCLLADTGLDFIRLSSGTYVLTRGPETPPQRGYLAGTVRDATTSLPLPDAQVVLAGHDVGTITNQDGRFVIPDLLAGPYRVEVHYLGYRVWTDSLAIRPEATTQTLVQLEAQPLVINPVVIDGLQRRVGGPDLRSSAPTTGALATVQTGLELADRLNALPGVRFSDITADVHVQGGAAGDHQLRLDGVPVFLPQRPLGLIGPFSPLAVGRLEAHTAGFEAETGSMLSGAVEAQHQLPDRTGLTAQVDALGLSAQGHLHRPGRRPLTLMGAVRTGYPSLRQDALQETVRSWSTPDTYLLRASIPDTTGFILQDSLAGPTALAPTLTYTDLHGAARWQLGPLRSLTASAYVGRSRLRGDVDEPDTEAARVGNNDDDFAGIALADAYTWRTQLGRLQYESVLSPKTLVRLSVSTSQHRLSHRYALLDSLSVLVDAEARALSNAAARSVADGNRMRATTLSAVLDHVPAEAILGGRHHLTLGLEATLHQSRFSLLSSQYQIGQSGPAIELFPDPDPQDLIDIPTFSVDEVQRQVIHREDAWLLAAVGQDRLRLSPTLEATGGVRLTYLPVRQTVYAEPRLAIRLDRTSWSARLASGLYRQYVNQFDVSTRTVAALLPHLRIWLPVDASVRPPLAYHLSQQVAVDLGRGWSVDAEAFARWHRHDVVLSYGALPTPDSGSGGVRQVFEQADFVGNATGYARGAHAAVRWTQPWARLHLRYAWHQTERTSQAVLDGRPHPVPWEEPHRLDARLDLQGLGAVLVQGRWQSVWGRPWGFRQAYYDYLAGASPPPPSGDFDLLRPADHRLPAHHQLDLSLGYRRTVGPADLMLRLQVVNVLDRANVLDWWLELHDDGQVTQRPRLSYPRLSTLALQVSW